MYINIYTYIHVHTHINVNIYTYVYMYMYISVSEIFGFTSQFPTQNCLDCYSKLNLSSKFHAEIAYLLHLKLRTLYILNIIL